MFFHLKNRALLKISGDDAESFLQSQLSNDIAKLDNSSVQLSAYCQHQGKILSLFWVIRQVEGFYLSFPKELLDSIQSRLKMFVIMADVTIEDVTPQLIQIGVLEEKYSPSFSINEKMSLIIIENTDLSNFDISTNDLWNQSCVDCHLPDVFLTTTEKFVPQMLNLDINEKGVSFSKGCYPGQEVVARLHYLGSAKRRLFAFKSNKEMLVGDSLYCSTSKTAKLRGDRYKGSGIVVSKVKFNSLFYCLGTLDVDLIDEEITLNNEHGPKLERINDE
jgi:folate-binding protein YgfZ